MITLLNERVISFSRDRLDIYWEIEPTTEDIQEYEFFIERSEAEAGPWQSIAGPLIDRYFFRDNSLNTISNNRTHFYRIRVLHKPTGREIFSPVIDRAGNEDLVASEIVRRERVLFQEFTGVKCWLFPIRTFGMRCPQCYDDILEKRTQNQCPTCFGTQFAGGYHHPIELFAQIDRPEAAEQVSMEDHRQTVYMVLRTNPSPDIKPLDLIVDHLNHRYRVISRGGTARFGVDVRQEVRMVMVQKGSIEDKVPLRIDEANEKLVAPRNFTNPQNLEAAGVDFDLDAVLGPYKY